MVEVFMQLAARSGNKAYFRIGLCRWTGRLLTIEPHSNSDIKRQRGGRVIRVYPSLNKTPMLLKYPGITDQVKSYSLSPEY